MTPFPRIHNIPSKSPSTYSAAIAPPIAATTSPATPPTIFLAAAAVNLAGGAVVGVEARAPVAICTTLELCRDTIEASRETTSQRLGVWLPITYADDESGVYTEAPIVTGGGAVEGAKVTNVTIEGMAGAGEGAAGASMGVERCFDRRNRWADPWRRLRWGGRSGGGARLRHSWGRLTGLSGCSGRSGGVWPLCRCRSLDRHRRRLWGFDRGGLRQRGA